jgi:hypothetical protein
MRIEKSRKSLKITWWQQETNGMNLQLAKTNAKDHFKL